MRLFLCIIFVLYYINCFDTQTLCRNGYFDECLKLIFNKNVKMSKCLQHL